MGDTEGAAAPSKKRFAAGQLSRDNPGLDDDGPEPQMGTFQRASDEVLATRKIVKVRRNQPPAASAAASNPFAVLSFATPADSDVKAMNAETQPTPAAESQTLPTTDAQTQPPKREVQKADDRSNIEHEKTDEDKGTQNVSRGNKVPETQSPAKEVGKADDGSNVEHEKTAENKESEIVTGGNEVSRSEDNGQNGQRDSDSQLENITGLSGDVSSDKGKDEMVKETSCSAEAEKEAENGNQEGESEAGASTEKESGEQKVDSDKKGKTESIAPLKSFQQLSSSQNAFSGLAGTGFSGTSFAFGSLAKDQFSFSVNSGSLFGLNNDKPSYPSFNTGSVNHGAPLMLFGTTPSDATKSGGGGITALQEVPLETGEENERAVFNADAILFEYLDGSWKERGKGELKVNVSTSDGERARLVMRAKGNYRLILNANLYPDMSFTNMEKRGITFACVNSAGEGKDGLATFALKFRDGSIVEEFRGAVMAHKGEKVTVLKTPENSPKASDD